MREGKKSGQQVKIKSKQAGCGSFSERESSS
jgi:hypothetical protein